MRFVAIAMSVSLLSFTAAAPAMAKEVSKSIYACDNNQTMEVVYINTNAGNSYAIIQQTNEMLPMEQMKMASGANYKAMDKNYTYKLYTKGDKADLVEGKDKPVLSNCKVAN